MTPIRTTTAHIMKIRYLLLNLTKYVDVGFSPVEGTNGILILVPDARGEDIVKIHWFELCLLHLSEYVAKHYAAQYPQFITHSWATEMIKQKILIQIHLTHPVDFLYDLFKNPTKYAEGV